MIHCGRVAGRQAGEPCQPTNQAIAHTKSENSLHSLVIGSGSRAAILILTIALAACGTGAAPSETADSPAESPIPSATHTAEPTQGFSFEETEPFAEAPEGSVEILMTFGPDFEPKEATAKAGTVVFFLKNDKGDGPPAAHNFLLGTAVDAPPLASSPLMGSGETGILTVEDLAPGTYAYWCTVPSPDGAPHSQYGMVGTLTVTQ